MFCTKCGENFPSDSACCTRCGAQVNSRNAAPDPWLPESPIPPVPAAEIVEQANPALTAAPEPVQTADPAPAQAGYAHFAQPQQQSQPLMQYSYALPPEYLPSGNDPSALPYMTGWNWGGFLLSWIWALGHEQITSGVIILVASMIPGLGTIVRWGFKIYFGLKGNELAWRNRRFDTISQFQDTQRAWTYWGAAIFGISIFIIFLYFILAIAGMLSGLHR